MCSSTKWVLCSISGKCSLLFLFNEVLSCILEMLLTLYPCRIFKKCMISSHKHFVYAWLHFFYVYICITDNTNMYFGFLLIDIPVHQKLKYRNMYSEVYSSLLAFLYCIIFWWSISIMFNIVEVCRETMIGAETYTISFTVHWNTCR